MKSIVKFLPAMAILLASGLAVATTNKTMAPQYYKNSSGQWRSISGDGIVFGDASGQYKCVAADYQCTAEGIDHLGNPTGSVVPGIATPNP